MLKSIINNQKKHILAQKNSTKGQAILEFIFTMIIVMLMIYSTVKIFEWTGKDAVERQRAHDTRLRQGGITRKEQIDPFFYRPIGMNAIWNGY